MTGYELERMDDDVYKKTLQDMAYDDVNFVTNITKGHSKIHVGTNDIELINRAFKEEVSGSSAFVDEEVYLESIADTIVFYADEITNWIMSSRQDIPDIKSYATFTCQLDLRNGDIGYGFRQNNLDKEYTSGVKIVLSRDMNNDSPMGFFLSTAYPCLDYSTKIDKTYTIEDIMDKSNITLSTEEKMYAYAKHKGIHGYVDNRYKEQSSVFKFEHNYDNITVKFTSMGCNIKLVNDERVKRLSLDELRDINKNIYEIVNQLNKQHNFLINQEKNIEDKSVC